MSKLIKNFLDFPVDNIYMKVILNKIQDTYQFVIAILWIILHLVFDITMFNDVHISI